MTSAELAALPELPRPTFTQREEIIDGERVMLPALPPNLVPWRTPDDPVCVHDGRSRLPPGVLERVTLMHTAVHETQC